MPNSSIKERLINKISVKTILAAHRGQFILFDKI